MSTASLPIPREQISDYMRLPAAVRQGLTLTLDVLREIDESGSKAAAIRDAAARYGHVRGCSEQSLERKYYRWLRCGRDWRAAIDRARAPVRWAKAGAVANAYKKYCEENQRCSREAWRAMVRDLHAGKALFGVGTWADVWSEQRPEDPLPAVCPQDWVPDGWTYENLQKRHKLTRWEATASRVGLGAAREFLPPVLTTRVGLLCGQIYQFDDMWHDAEVNFDGQARGLRPLEFCAYDVASASKIAWGLRPQLVNEETGKRDRLKEREFRFLLVHVLCDVGWHKGGCRLMVEHGTAAIRAELEKQIARLTGGTVTVDRSGILGEQVQAGMWPGRGGGNFRFKALVESGHSLSHNLLAAAPGQVGKDRDSAPEQMAGMTRYNADLLKAAAALAPERAALLMLPLLPFGQYAGIVNEAYERMDWRAWHNLEGWEQAGWMVSEYRLGEESNWFSQTKLLAMPADQRAAVTAYLGSAPEMMRVRRLSPREVWMRGQGELSRLPWCVVPELLGQDDGAVMRVGDDGMIAFEDRYLGPGRHVYHGAVETPEGFVQTLCRGREYLLHVSPYRPESVIVSDRDSGAVLGMAARYERAPAFDRGAVLRLAGKQAHAAKMLAEPVQARHQDAAAARAAMAAHNEAVLAGVPMRAGEVAAAERVLGVQGRIEELLVGAPAAAGADGDRGGGESAGDVSELLGGRGDE
jgi:hypothetical protein